MLQPCPVFIFAPLGASSSHALQHLIVFLSYLKFLILHDLCPETEKEKFIFFLHNNVKYLRSKTKQNNPKPMQNKHR